MHLTVECERAQNFQLFIDGQLTKSSNLDIMKNGSIIRHYFVDRDVNDIKIIETNNNYAIRCVLNVIGFFDAVMYAPEKTAMYANTVPLKKRRAKLEISITEITENSNIKILFKSKNVPFEISSQNCNAIENFNNYMLKAKKKHLGE